MVSEYTLFNKLMVYCNGKSLKPKCSRLYRGVKNIIRETQYTSDKLNNYSVLLYRYRYILHRYSPTYSSVPR